MSYLTMQTTEIGQAQVTEALLRMKKLNLLDGAIEQFKDDGKILKSENFCVGTRDNRIPILYDLSAEETEMVREWEKRTGNMVYHVIQNRMIFGLCYSFLYVSKYTEDWESDNEYLKEGIPLVYVLNADDDMCSEYGSIGIKPMFGAILRTA